MKDLSSLWEAGGQQVFPWRPIEVKEIRCSALPSEGQESLDRGVGVIIEVFS